MLNCREVSRLVSESFDRRLPWRARFLVAFHLAMCRICSGFRRTLRLMEREVRRQAGNLPSPEDPVEQLPDDARQRLDEMVRRFLGNGQ
ncbi:MAG: hypothetical protein KatS3mg110_0144 [Pirellulaceae bacterium]|nr:MAG: hypothetical protein KatS3mg110_0144 [Pirellulaceae bacterium]